MENRGKGVERVQHMCIHTVGLAPTGHGLCNWPV